jgi:hypothetical protein
VSGSLIPISDEEARLGQEVLKTLRGLGSFFEKTLGSTPEDLVAHLGGDWLRVRRAENLVRLFEAARRRLADLHVEEPMPASLSVALPILRGAADEDREELVDLWARLLANAMDPSLNSVRQQFIDATKKTDPPDAILLEFLYREKLEVIRRRPGVKEDNATHVGLIADRVGRRMEDIEVSLRHLKA